MTFCSQDKLKAPQHKDADATRTSFSVLTLSASERPQANGEAPPSADEHVSAQPRDASEDARSADEGALPLACGRYVHSYSVHDCNQLLRDTERIEWLYEDEG